VISWFGQRDSFTIAGCLVLACATGGCARPGEYVWFQQLPQETTLASNEYIIGVGDVVSIHVFGREEMTVHERVRTDGRLSLLLIGDVEAKGKRPSALKAELESLGRASLSDDEYLVAVARFDSARTEFLKATTDERGLQVHALLLLRNDLRSPPPAR